LTHALQFHAAEDLRLAETESKPLARDEVRIAVKSIGICGANLSYYFKDQVGDFALQEPLIFGHEDDPLRLFEANKGMFDIDPQSRVHALSRTEKSLVAIARALAVDARILVLDEPTASLPQDEVERLFRFCAA